MEVPTKAARARARDRVKGRGSRGMTVYEDLFLNEDLAESYRKGRPTYPPALYELLKSLTPQHELAWDVGTGNGQAAVAVAEHFTKVVATDISESQLFHAMKGPNITYAKMSATPDSVEELERVVGPEGSVDLVTVAAALHWFDRDKFYPIVKRMLRKPGGVIAAFSYTADTIITCPEFDEELRRFYPKMAPFMSGVRYSFKEMEFPFDPVPGVEAGTGVEGSPLQIKVQRPCSFDDFLLFLRTFSAFQTALDRGVNLLDEDTRRVLGKAWGPENVRTVSMTVSMLIGSVNSTASEN